MENKSNNNSPTSIIHEGNLIADHIKTSSKSKFQSISLIFFTYHLLLVYIFPNSLKSAKVIPIHKKNSKWLVSNYIPISLLSNLDKIMEKLMYNQIIHFLENNKIIYYKQFH